jgi:hypothetical protein
VYSCGIGAQGNRPYGFPKAATVAAYQGAGWGPQLSTAEGGQVNGLPQPAVNGRGNIRIGAQGALDLRYNHTAFFNFPLPIT